MKLSTRSKGEIAMLKVQLKAYEKNLVVSFPTNNEIYYDLIIDNPKNSKELKRSQVKYCNKKHGKNGLEIMLNNPSSKRIFYRHTDIDWLLVFLPSKDVILKYEQKYFHRKKRIYINLKQERSRWFYKHFIW